MEEVILTRVEAGRMRKQLIDLSNAMTRDHYAFSKLLYEINTAQIQVGKEDNFVPLWKAWGHGSFEEFAEREIGMHYSTAHSNCKMHYVFFVLCAGKFDVEKLHALSITRARDIAKVVRPTNVQGWINKASAMSCCELKEAVDHARKGTDRRGRLQGFHCTMKVTEAKAMKRAIAFLKTELGLETTGDVIAKALPAYAAILQSKPQQLRRKVKAA
jgi:hypothetical protein